MAHTTKSIKINAPVERVFDYVTSPENWTTYVTSLVDVRNVSDESPRAGTTFEWTYRMLGLNFDGRGSVVEFEKNRKFAMAMEGSFPIRETFVFEEDSGVTTIRFDIKYDVPGKVLGVISNSSVVEKMNKKEAAAVLNKVKDICEAGER
jgi:ligand-binding SRPBCC domain-containing protein